MNAPVYKDRTIPEMASRGFWMMLGPMLLVPLGFKIVEHGQGWLTAFDYAFLGTILAMILARGFEFYKGRPRTAEGAPATREHFWRYLTAVMAVGAVVWVVANILGNYVFEDTWF